MMGHHISIMDPHQQNITVQNHVTERILDHDDIDITELKQLVVKEDSIFPKIQALKEELFGEDNDENEPLDTIQSIQMNGFLPNHELEDENDMEKFANTIAYKMKKVDSSLLTHGQGNIICSTPVVNDR